MAISAGLLTFVELVFRKRSFYLRLFTTMSHMENTGGEFLERSMISLLQAPVTLVLYSWEVLVPEGLKSKRSLGLYSSCLVWFWIWRNTYWFLVLHLQQRALASLVSTTSNKTTFNPRQIRLIRKIRLLSFQVSLAWWLSISFVKASMLWTWVWCFFFSHGDACWVEVCFSPLMRHHLRIVDIAEALESAPGLKQNEPPTRPLDIARPSEQVLSPGQKQNLPPTTLRDYAPPNVRVITFIPSW